MSKQNKLTEWHTIQTAGAMIDLVMSTPEIRRFAEIRKISSALYRFGLLDSDPELEPLWLKSLFSEDIGNRRSREPIGYARTAKRAINIVRRAKAKRDAELLGN